MSENYLKTIRTVLGLTQAEMATEIGLSRRAYIDAENADEIRKLHLMAAERVALRYAGHGWIAVPALPPHLLQEAENMAEALG